MSYPLVQTGSLTLPSGVYTMRVAQVQVQRQVPLFAVAGSGSNHSQFVQGIAVEEYVGTGVIKKDGEETFGLAQTSTMTLPSDLDVKAQSWRVRRRWQPIDVTGSGDSAKEYVYGLPSTSISASGVAKNGYIADHAAESLSITTQLAQFGTLAGTVKLQQKSDGISFVQGGVPMVQFAGEYSQQPTFTPLTAPGTNDDFEWLLGSSVTAPVEGTLTLDAGDATDLTPNVMVYDVETSLVPRDGGAIRVTCRMRKTL